MAQSSQSKSTDRQHLAHEALINPLAASQLQHLGAAQNRILDETKAFYESWFARRYRTAEALTTLASEMMSAGMDTTKTGHAISSWQDGARERLTEDLRDWMKLCNHCAGYMARELSDAEGEILAESAKLAKATSGTKHSTPV